MPSKLKPSAATPLFALAAASRRALGTSMIAAALLGASASASAGLLSTFTDRATFTAQLGASVTDDYESAGYAAGDVSNTIFLDIFSHGAMSGVFGQTRYTSTSFNNPTGWNMVGANNSGDREYCAGCNGSFILDFTATSVGSADGVFGVGFNLTSTGYTAFITFGDGSTQNFSLAGSAPFIGFTSPDLIRSIAIGLPDGEPTTGVSSIAIDDLTIGAAAVPEPGTVGLVALALAGALRLRRSRS